MVIIGIIVGTFGVHGELKVKTNTDFVNKRFKIGNTLKLKSPKDDEIINVTIKSHKKSTKNLEIISFKEYDDTNVVNKFIGYQILIENPINELNKGQYYYADLWYCKVYLLDNLIGEVIDLFDVGSNVILRIKRDNEKDLLYPFVDKFISKVDIENKTIVLNPIEGMID